MDEAFWTHPDAQIIASRPEDHGQPMTAAIPMGASVDADKADTASAAPLSPVVADWTGVLDILTTAKSTAQQQEMRLREQAVGNAALLEELRRTQQVVRAHEILLREVQAQADTKIEEFQAQAEAGVRDLQAETAAQLRATEERARVAEARAETAEDWLKRIKQASRVPLPNDQQAAA